MGVSAINFSLQQGVRPLPWPCDVARQDALTLLRSLPDELQRRLEDYLQDELADLAREICGRPRRCAVTRSCRSWPLAPQSWTTTWPQIGIDIEIRSSSI